MPKIVRVHDPSERYRRLPLIIQEEICPGLLEFFSSLAYRSDAPLVRAVLYQWYLHHKEAGTLETATAEALTGPGGVTKRARAGRAPLASAPVIQASPKAAGAPSRPTQDVPFKGDPPVVQSGKSRDECEPQFHESVAHLSMLDTMF